MRVPNSTHWNAAQYSKFADHRLRPALELLQRVPVTSPRLVYDLGCGTGTVARIMAERWPEAHVIGIDHSEAMLARARIETSSVEWLQRGIADWEPAEPPDLVYSNAALHWLEDHDRLFRRLIDYVRENGCLAVQMPLSWDLPSHRMMREVLETGGFGSAALRARLNSRSVHGAEFYYDVLSDRARSIDIWETEYVQELTGDDPVLEWVRGTGLRPVLNELRGDDLERFLEGYGASLRAAYPKHSNGVTLYPFRRLFIVATR